MGTLHQFQRRVDRLEERIQAAFERAAREQAWAAQLRAPFNAELRVRLPDGSYAPLEWEPWMGPRDNLAALLQAIDLATEKGKNWYGPRTLDEMTREYARIMARRPKGETSDEHTDHA